MVEKIQYLLILLLFVTAGSLEEESFREGMPDASGILTQATDTDSAAAARNQLSAWTHSCDYPAETPVVHSGHKIVARHRAALRSTTAAVFGIRPAACLRDDALPGHAVDYYVFSLGRILI